MSTRESSTLTAGSSARMHYLDWLRVFAMLSVFLYHSNRFFNAGDWHVKNAQLSQVSSIFENFLGVWIMPLMFVLSGAAVFFSLKSRSARVFSGERVLRLMVPLLTVGLFVFGPLQVYLERLTHGDFNGSFWQFLPHYFEGFYAFGGNFAWMGIHLWYLMVLSLFSFLLLPLFLPSRNNGLSLLSRLSSGFDKPWVLLLLFFPLGLAIHLTNALGLGFTRQMGGWDIFSYMLFFAYGYMLFAHPRTGETIRKFCFVFLTAAATLTVFWLVMRYAVMPTPQTGFFFSAELRTLMSWLWILAFLGLGNRFLNRRSESLGYANEAVLPFYVLHQPLILTVGYFIVPLSAGIFPKFVLIVAISFLIIMAVYHLAVRRTAVLRFLFGMKTTNRSTPKTEVVAEPAPGAGVKFT